METPVVLHANAAKNTYRAVALSQLRILKREMELANLSESSRVVRLENGVIIACKKSFKQETIDIFVPENSVVLEENKKVVGFIMHPKSGNVRKRLIQDGDEDYFLLTSVASEGFKKDGTWVKLGDYASVYSFSDIDKTAFTVTPKNLAIEYSQIDNKYGNLYWTDGIHTVSWRGNPSVQFPIPGKLAIPDISTFVNGRYTVFSNKIYAKGRVIAEFEAACLVAAAFLKKCDDKMYLFAVINKLVNGIYWMQLVKTANVAEGWEVVYEENTGSVLTLTAAVSKDCKKLMYNDVVYTINDNCTQVLKDAYQLSDTINGFCNVVGTGGYSSSYEYVDKGVCWPCLDADGNFAFSAFDVNAKFGYSGSSSNIAEPPVRKVPAYRGSPAESVSVYFDPNAPLPCDINADGKYAAVFVATVNGSYCSVTWNGVDCFNGLSAVKLLDSCDTSVTVSCTANPQGVIGTYERATTLPALVVGGPDSMGLGTQFTVANAVDEVYWSVSAGAIDHITGIITSMEGASCGTATVSVVDKCGRTASKVVRLPSGVWISNEDRCCIQWVDVPDPIKQYVQCNEYQCYGAEWVVGATKYYYQSWPGWGWSYEGICNNCGPASTTTKQSYRWECP